MRKVLIAFAVFGVVGSLGLVMLGIGGVAMLTALIGDDATSASWCAPAADAATPAAVGEILAAGERTAAGMNAATLAVFAADMATGMATPTRITASAATPAGMFSQTATDYPGTSNAVFGTSRDPRIATKVAAGAWLDKLVKLLRANGAGSAYESPAAIQAAVLALGAPGDGGRLFSRWKQADIAAALANPSAARPALTLVNAVSGVAGGPVSAASSSVLIRSTTSWSNTGRWLSSIVGKRSEAAAAGRSVLVLGDDVIGGVADDLGDVGYAVNARATWTVNDINAALAQPRATSAGAWVIGLFTNKSARVTHVAAIVDAVHNAAGDRRVFWVTPFRNSAIDKDEEPPKIGPDGLPIEKDEATRAAEAQARSSQAIAAELRTRASARGGMVLDWTPLAESNPGWFAGNDARPIGVGEDAYVMLITAAAGTTGVADAVVGNCEDDASTLTSIDASKAVVLNGPSGKFTDGPVIGTTSGGGAAKMAAVQASWATSNAAVALSDAQAAALTQPNNAQARQRLQVAQATYSAALRADAQARTAAGTITQPKWVERALARAQRALVEPPCDDNPRDSMYGCDGMCAQLAARIFGQTNGLYRPGAKRWAYSMWLALAGGASKDVARIGSGREFTPPVGAMLFWYMGPNHPGHVAVYIGGGAIVTNYRDQRVVQMPAQRLVDEYSGYVGWAVPPVSWQS